MDYAIFLNMMLPVRAEASEASEMVTQLLFGESCRILNEKDSFVEIENYQDKYRGWVDRKMLTPISIDIFNNLAQSPLFRTIVPIADVFCMNDKSIYRLSAGSTLPFYNYENSDFEIAGQRFQIHPSFVTYLPGASKDNIIASARLFINTPYLWGGKSILGIDCSGLTQVVYSMNGYDLPRDSGVQAKEGIGIKSLTDAEPTDLLFFSKNEKNTHVGIYLGNNKIIHASGKVRIDKVDEKGIYNEDIMQYTHNLSVIKRI